MSELLETLTEKISAPEYKGKLTNFLSVVRDVVSSQAKVTLLDTGNRFILSQKDGVIQVTVSKDFVANMGDFELCVDGSTEFTSNVHLNMSAPVQAAEEIKQPEPTRIEFVKNGEMYKSNISNAVLDCFEDVRMVNLLKRQGLPLAGFNTVRKFLGSKGFAVYVAGEEEEERSKPVEEPGTTVVQVSATESTVGERIVFKEVPVYVDRIVLKEVPVEVQKVVIKEVPVYIEAPQKVVEPPQEIIVQTKGPIEDPSPEPTPTPTPEESEDEFEESEPTTEESSEVPSESSEPAEASHTQRKLKGRWLNVHKTILKSGDYVYRVNKKIDGPTELFAIGRWDKDKQKQVALKKSDHKIIKKLGNKIAKK